MLGGHAPAIHLKLETFDRRSCQVPGQARVRRTAVGDCLGIDGVKFMHGIDLRRRGIDPGDAEAPQSSLHLGQHVAGLLAHGIGAGFPVADGAPAILSSSLSGLAASETTKVGMLPSAATVKLKACNEGSPGACTLGHTLLRATGLRLAASS